LVPANAGRKVSATLIVSVMPLAETLDPAPFKMHWLFCWVPLPGVMPLAGDVPASVSSISLFCAQL
jgi:hypothetical protein